MLVAIDLGQHLGLLDIPPQFEPLRWKIEPIQSIAVAYYGYAIDLHIIRKTRIIGPIVFVWSSRLQQFDLYTT